MTKVSDRPTEVRWPFEMQDLLVEAERAHDAKMVAFICEVNCICRWDVPPGDYSKCSPECGACLFFHERRGLAQSKGIKVVHVKACIRTLNE